MKKLLGIFLALFASLSLANPIDASCPQHVVWGAPQVAVEGNNQYLCRTGYAVNYNYQTKVAYWVAEVIKPELLITKAVSRKDDFREDPEIPAPYRVTLKDYVGSGLDRGHMAPAANFTYDAGVMSESFLLTNMMPQSPGNNRGIWKYLEENTRFWASKYGHLNIITGTIFDANSQTMGNGVKVPSFVYKIVIDPKRNASIAFMFPNAKLDPKEIEKYVVSISDIEAYTGINFSPMIPANLKSLETNKGNYKDW